MAYIQGEPRNQTSLFPVSLEDLIPEDHLVRVIDAYVAGLDLVQLGFGRATPKGTGRPSYDPADQLKLYLYGYFQRIRSSRRLEAECQRNVEVMWLINRLKPDFKTIADFRRDNKTAFIATCRAFVQFCRAVGLIAGDLVAIDGSKFRTVASARRHLNLKQLKLQEEKLDKRIAQYLVQLDEADKDEAGETVDRSAIKTALARLEDKQSNNRTCQALMKSMDLEQFNAHESDARMMRTAKGPRVAYNVQTAVDAEHCLILHHAVTQDGDDRRQLEPMAKEAKEQLQQPELTVTADAGYSNGQQFQACEDANITAYVPPSRSKNSSRKGKDFFDRKDFVYDVEHDHYQCPAGQLLTLKQLHNGNREYQAIKDCTSCALKAQCTDAPRRYVSRHANEDAFERMGQRMRAHPEMMVSRRSIVEHPFGNLKQWLFGNGRFLLRQLEGARAEMALAINAYNLKRVINVLGARQLMALMG
ncbi:IS1182 family transposase [Pseudomonas sp. B21-048]|uniref:IS1182 family transposase n=1 Tax=Pseudomonas sp. B21-048 TaxID=2895490 RepID=UPI00215DF53F|nr:IS1182 family transposase [Pseudomonas sp. B21-048]UVK96768.1 IS1182 family transposase [Pseudomonas sp. B21-048]UVK97412.1 IS1182 family transposase [Pseudomonas sp. B21-048]UVK98332.1 IS1182 family transposase [Pseudomonas sp. B21-048]UVK99405.1 IS1182 family transposase [Pseudomonas sp. B21-048]UVL01030.1 IS1182 family transposase [Pseudomonas sp. B21-048]